jgi:hypothetical protein
LPLAKSRDKEKEGNKLPFGDEKNSPSGTFSFSFGFVLLLFAYFFFPRRGTKGNKRKVGIKKRRETKRRKKLHCFTTFSSLEEGRRETKEEGRKKLHCFTSPKGCKTLTTFSSLLPSPKGTFSRRETKRRGTYLR